MLLSLNNALQAAEQHGQRAASGQADIFGGTTVVADVHAYASAPEWTEEQRLAGEKETLGLYLTGHPIARFAEELARLTEATIAELKPTKDRAVVVAGLVVGIRSMQTRRGDRMAFITLDDRTGRLEIAVFSELFGQCRELLVKDALLVVEGQVSVDEYTGGFKMSADKVYNIEQARAARGARLVISLPEGSADNGFVDELGQILQPAVRGGCPVYLRYQSAAAEAEIALGEEWKIMPTASVLSELSRLAGEKNVRIDYR